MSDEDIYGSALMSEEERNRYRKQLAEQETKQARDRYQVQHERKMQDRAIQQGRELVPPGQGKVYGGELMSLQERNEYREQLRQLKSEDERMQFQAQHREKIDERAEALKLQVEEAE